MYCNNVVCYGLLVLHFLTMYLPRKYSEMDPLSVLCPTSFLALLTSISAWIFPRRSQNMTPYSLYLSPAGCSCLQFWDKVSNAFQIFRFRFAATYSVSSLGRPLTWILFQNWVMRLVLPTSKFGYQPSTVWKQWWNIHGT